MLMDFTGKVMERKQLTEDVLFLSLQIPREFSFKAGQYVMVKITNQGQTRWKSYSILNPPTKKGFIDLCVKILDNGFASEVFKQLSVGVNIQMKGPLGHFVFEPTEEEHWFIGAGTGVAPLYSMILEHLPKHPYKKFRLIFGVRAQQNLLFHEEFLHLAQKYPNFEYLPTLSRETWEGKMGRVQQHLSVDLSHKVFYLCGLKELVLETKELLVDRGVASTKIRFERYT